MRHLGAEPDTPDWDLDGAARASERVLTSADFGIMVPNQPPPLRLAPTVFMEVLRHHTYHGRTQTEGDVYLAHEEEVENIENLKFAKRIPAPPRAIRPR